MSLRAHSPLGWQIWHSQGNNTNPHPHCDECNGFPPRPFAQPAPPEGTRLRTAAQAVVTAYHEVRGIDSLTALSDAVHALAAVLEEKTP